MTFRSLLSPVVLLSALVLVGCGGVREPSPNLTLLRWQCIEWHDSGAYERAFRAAAEPANRALDHYLRQPTPQNFAVVFDIDETLLSNWTYLRSSDFAIHPEKFAAMARREKGVPLRPLAEVYARAHAYQIPIFLVTGRPESIRAATIHDLETAGYWGWSGLFMAPNTYRERSIIPFKSGVRKMLTDRGYDIILNVGDQDSDLAGGFARNRVKLPNPFYFIP